MTASLTTRSSRWPPSCGVLSRKPSSSCRATLHGFFTAAVAAGYLGLAAAAAKLVLVDLEGTSTALRAVAFLVSGGIFLGAALLAHRFGEHREEAS